MNDDKLEHMLRQADAPVADAGFSAGVLAGLPARRQASPHPGLLLLAYLLGSILVLELFPLTSMLSALVALVASPWMATVVALVISGLSWVFARSLI
jgi:hypothetical protein